LKGEPVVSQETIAAINSARLFSLAFLLSFLGSLPPGTTNLMTVQLVASNGLMVAALFSLGCLLAELVAVSASVFLVDRMLRFKGVTRLLQWISLFVLFALTIFSFIAAGTDSSDVFIPVWDGSSPLIVGFVMMLINPVQVPFWLGWTTVLVEKRILQTAGFHYVLYVAGTAIGSILASVCFMVLGKVLVDRWSIAPSAFHQMLGILFLVSFMLQLRKMMDVRVKPNPV
jgi:threonine/homoserine/homoserine lactone efflux protein